MMKTATMTASSRVPPTPAETPIHHRFGFLYENEAKIVLVKHGIR